jgi:hypothetical protein
MDGRTKNNLYNKIITLLGKNPKGKVHIYTNTARLFTIVNYENHYGFYNNDIIDATIYELDRKFLDEHTIVYIDYVKELNAEPKVLYGRRSGIPQIR